MILKKRQWLGLVFACTIFLGCGDQGARNSFDELASFNSEELLKVYDELLLKYVDPESQFVAYAQWQQDGEDVAKLNALVESLEGADVEEMTQKEKMAFYINAYNLVTLQLIVTRYNETIGNDWTEGRSIVNIGGHGFDIWKEIKVKVGGPEPISIDDIEHQILRPMGDARIHFAVNCASIGCPPLMRKSFQAESLEADLNQLSSEFVNSGRETSTRFLHRSRRIETSKIISWFKKDFIDSYGSVLNFFQKYYLPGGDADPEELSDRYRIRYFAYDWTLNEVQELEEDTPDDEDDEDDNGGGGSTSEESFF